MKFQINRGLLPIKAHFFFFFAALGPILPQLNVFGRQLGVSPAVMGMVTAVLPLLWAAAKPLFGYVVDFWPSHRKLVFMILISVMTGSYCGLWFIPMPMEDVAVQPTTEPPILEYVYTLNDTIFLEPYDDQHKTALEKYNCHWSCSKDYMFQVYLTNSTYINRIYVDKDRNMSCSLLEMDSDGVRQGQMTCTPKSECNLLCYEDDLINSTSNRTKREIDEKNNNTKVPSHNNNINGAVNNIIKNSDINKIVPTKTEKNDIKNPENETQIKTVDMTKTGLNEKDIRDKISKVIPNTVDETDDTDFYMTAAFWSFVVLMCVGTVAFNVANCIGDAVCFDVLGTENASKYGGQRAWGTVGYGATALIGGWLVDVASKGRSKDFTPAFVLALAATGVDLYCCTKLKLPSLTSPDDSGKALREVLKIPRVVVFIIFAVVAGTFDSFIIYYMFWFLEELAEQTGHMHMIKLIEGVVVAGQSFIGELLFFALSGRIITRWGYGTTMTLSLFCYGIRMACISLIQHPWHLVVIESIMQGPTYALCYSSIVGYAAHVAPEGYSATVQGIVAGMDDGVGFALGSLVGGQLYSWAGGRGSFRILGVVAGFASLIHVLLFRVVTRSKPQPPVEETPEEGQKMLPVLDNHNAIYRETLEPLTGSKENR